MRLIVFGSSFHKVIENDVKDIFCENGVDLLEEYILSVIK